MCQRPQQTAQGRHEAIHCLDVGGILLPELLPEKLLFGEHYRPVDSHKSWQDQQVPPATVGNKHQPGDDQQIPEVQRIPRVGEDAVTDEDPSSNLFLTTAATDIVDTPNSEETAPLSEHSHGKAYKTQPAIKLGVAKRQFRRGGQYQYDKYKWEEIIAVLK